MNKKEEIPVINLNNTAKMQEIQRKFLIGRIQEKEGKSMKEEGRDEFVEAVENKKKLLGIEAQKVSVNVGNNKYTLTRKESLLPDMEAIYKKYPELDSPEFKKVVPYFLLTPNKETAESVLLEA